MSRKWLLYMLLLSAAAVVVRGESLDNVDDDYVDEDDISDDDEYDDEGNYDDDDRYINGNKSSDDIARISSFQTRTIPKTRGLLYPTESETREVRLLNGIWRFLKSDQNEPWRGVTDRWYDDNLSKFGPVIPMPVPSSYNDISTDKAFRDHVGTVWYERRIYIPKAWSSNRRVWLRFGSVHYSATVWLNGENVTKHEIGHLPFEVEITNHARYGALNRITVMCDNTLSGITVPQGKVHSRTNSNGTRVVSGMHYSFDFFNYAGIHRSVHLYTTPKVFIEDLFVTTDLSADKTGFVNYEVTANIGYKRNVQPLYVTAKLLNRKQKKIIRKKSLEGTLSGQLEVPRARPWWPYLMHPNPGYLYTLEIHLHAADKTLLDVYRTQIGIRKLQWTNTSVLLNGKELYLRGLGRHEDSDIRGRGYDLAVLTRDFNLLKWSGANSYRTSNYPHSEESMQLADRFGIMVINECPSVATSGFTAKLLRNHKSSIEQLIHRDRNHASVIMWSIAAKPKYNKGKYSYEVQRNEIRKRKGKQRGKGKRKGRGKRKEIRERKKNQIANSYFKNVVAYTRSLDPMRPITACTSEDKDLLHKYIDVISYAKYLGWKESPGNLDNVYKSTINYANNLNEQYKKPVLISKYGAETLEGLHLLPEYVWSEEYQSFLLAEHFKAFDSLRKQNKWFIGEFVWNFADYKTQEGYTLMGGSKKGIFTRSRQPKSAAYVLRQRYHYLGHLLDASELPADIVRYTVDLNNRTLKHDLSKL